MVAWTTSQYPDIGFGDWCGDWRCKCGTGVGLGWVIERIERARDSYLLILTLGWGRVGRGRQSRKTRRKICLGWTGIHLEQSIFEVPIIYPSGEVKCLRAHWSLRAFGLYKLFRAMKKNEKIWREIRERRRKRIRTPRAVRVHHIWRLGRSILCAGGVLGDGGVWELSEDRVSWNGDRSKHWLFSQGAEKRASRSVPQCWAALNGEKAKTVSASKN